MYKERVPSPKIASNGAKNEWCYADFFVRVNGVLMMVIMKMAVANENTI